MTLFLLSLTGIPPTAGFFAKAYVILAAVQASDAGWTSLGVLAVIAVLNAAAAAFYYLRVVVYMFMREPRTEEAPLAHGNLLWGGLVVASVLTVVLGLIPGPFLRSWAAARRSAATSEHSRRVEVSTVRHAQGPAAADRAPCTVGRRAYADRCHSG